MLQVRQIHQRLPPGGILVFVTGQREVEHLCRKLRSSLGPAAAKRAAAAAATAAAAAEGPPSAPRGAAIGAAPTDEVLRLYPHPSHFRCTRSADVCVCSTWLRHFMSFRNLLSCAGAAVSHVRTPENHFNCMLG